MYLYLHKLKMLYRQIGGLISKYCLKFREQTSKFENILANLLLEIRI